MRITLNKWSALFFMRELRRDRERSRMLSQRVNVVAPDPAPLKRWGRSNFAEQGGVLGRLPGHQVYVAVPCNKARLKAQGVVNTIYGPKIPEGSFIDMGDGIAISGPELLFVEMAALMHPIEHLMLGHELCGSFGRDARDPRNGDVLFSLPPLTSVARIGEFLDAARNIRGIAQARNSLARLNDNAWSPTESLIAAFLRAPIDDMGFGFDSLVLNERVFRTEVLPGSLESRVPDILVGGTRVGLNYDGLVHLDLGSIARAAFEMGANPGEGHTEVELRQATDRVRAKVLDDIRRNRELAAGGYTVLPVLKEDLYQPGGFDQLVSRMVDLLEGTGANLREPKRALSSRVLGEDRYRLLRSLLPGTYEPDVELGRYISGFRIADDKPETITCWVEF